MKRTFILIIGLLLTGSVAWATPDDVYDMEGGVYLGLSAQYLRLDLPDYSPIVLEDSSWHFIEFLNGSGGREEAVMPGLTLGLPIPALNMVLELGAEVADWNGQANKVYDYTSTYRVGWLALDGSQKTVGFGGGDDVAARVNRSGDYYRFELMAKYPLQLGAIRIVPFAGPSFMSLEEDFALRAYEVQTSSNQLLQDEQLDSDYLGGRVGVTLAGRLCRFATWELSPSFGLYHLDADYRGSQQDIGLIGYTATAKDDKSRTTTAASVLGKISLEYKQLSLSFFAGLDYLEDVAKIRHSNLSTGDYNDANADGMPAHMEFDSSLNSRFGIELGFNFW